MKINSVKQASKQLIQYLVIALFVAGAASTVQAQDKPPSNIAQIAQPQIPPIVKQRVKEFIQLINSGDRKATRFYIKENFAPSELEKLQIEGEVDFISETHDQTGGVELDSITQRNPNRVSALVQSKITGSWLKLLLVLETQSPDQFTGWGVSFSASAPPGVSQSSRKLSEKEIVREIDSFVGKLSSADTFSGAILFAKDDKILFQKSYGEANKDFRVPNRLDTRFNVASVGKMFTAVAIAQLVEQGKIEFDAPIGKYLPAGALRPEILEKVRIEHLLTHTSGLGEFVAKYRAYPRTKLFRTVDDLLPLVKDDALLFEPGTRWEYSNTGYLVLGKIIEQVTGLNYFDYIRKNILIPAGMPNTDFYDPDYVNPNSAVGYFKEYTDKKTLFRNNNRYLIPSGPVGGSYSTVEDLLRFTVALRSNRLVGDKYVKLMLTPKPDLKSPGYGYGFTFNSLPKIAGHSGGSYGMSTFVNMFLDSGYTSIVLSNYGSNASGFVAVKIQNLVTTGKEDK